MSTFARAMANFARQFQTLLGDRVIPQSALALPGFSSVATNTALTAANHNGSMLVTATATITLPDAATVGEGWVSPRICNGGSGAVTVARAGSDTIEYGADTALASVVMAKRGNFIQLVSTGSGWFVVDSKVDVFIHGYSSSMQSIDTGTTTTLSWTGVNDDTHSGWEATTTDRYTCPYTGEYEVRFQVDIDTPAALDFVPTVWRDNGSEFEMIGGSRQLQADTTGNSYTVGLVSGNITCAAGDEIFFRVWHNRGSAVNVFDSTIVARNYFDIRRVQN